MIRHIVFVAFMIQSLVSTVSQANEAEISCSILSWEPNQICDCPSTKVQCGQKFIGYVFNRDIEAFLGWSACTNMNRAMW